MAAAPQMAKITMFARASMAGLVRDVRFLHSAVVVPAGVQIRLQVDGATGVLAQ